jgi:aconitate hydratase
MGVIPFEFTGGDNRKSLGLKGTETFDIEGLGNDIRPLSMAACRITYADGTVKEIQLKCRIDTEIEVDYLKHGGVLHYVLRNLARPA